MSDAFKDAAEKIKTLSDAPSNDVLLKLYALYKQATEGDVRGSRPSMFDFKGAAKYDAWAKLKGKTSVDAEKEYIDLVNSLVG
jgi:diazepam-binding inhibitor (GABA receptor modulating acyl-CoA-binding protein)